ARITRTAGIDSGIMVLTWRLAAWSDGTDSAIMLTIAGSIQSVIATRRIVSTTFSPRDIGPNSRRAFASFPWSTSSVFISGLIMANVTIHAMKSPMNAWGGPATDQYA